MQVKILVVTDAKDKVVKFYLSHRTQERLLFLTEEHMSIAKLANLDL